MKLSPATYVGLGIFTFFMISNLMGIHFSNKFIGISSACVGIVVGLLFNKHNSGY
jgi:hypothetical protein